MKLIKVYTLNSWERYHGFRDDELKTDVLYWIENSRLHKFYFDNDAYRLTDYVFDSDFFANEFTTLMMKQILVYLNWNTIIIKWKYYVQNHFSISRLFKNY